MAFLPPPPTPGRSGRQTVPVNGTGHPRHRIDHPASGPGPARPLTAGGPLVLAERGYRLMVLGSPGKGSRSGRVPRSGSLWVPTVRTRGEVRRITSCTLHDWPRGWDLTTEGLPRCPHCRLNFPGGIGPRPKKKRTRGHAAAQSTRPYLDHAQRAAGEHLEDL